jgi:type II secretion system-associated lipoprotein
MKKFKTLLFLSALFFSALSCSTFVKEKEAEKLVKYEKSGDQFIDYTLLQDVKTGDHLIKKGEKVRILITVGGDWIKVYVYRAEEDLLLSRRNLALYLFEDDFPDKKYDPDFLREKINEVVKPLK